MEIIISSISKISWLMDLTGFVRVQCALAHLLLPGQLTRACPVDLGTVLWAFYAL